jgi:hypothetical protein
MDMTPASPTLLPSHLGLDGQDLVERKKASRGPSKIFRTTFEVVNVAPPTPCGGSPSDHFLGKAALLK